MTTRNASLLRAVADKIESDPEHWDQARFTTRRISEDPYQSCDTGHCIGGWAAALSGFNVNHTSVAMMGRLLGLEFEEYNFLFFNGMGQEEGSEVEVANWLRAIADGADVEESAPEWWRV